MTDPEPLARFGDYQALALLGRGGMGEVFLSRKSGAQGFTRLAALKVLREGFEADAAARRLFLDEAQILARLSHPSVAQVYDFGESPGGLYLAMEYVSGVSFAWLRAARAAPPEVAAALVAQAARGLHSAHVLQDVTGRPLAVVHRDVSPQNLMVSFEGAVKVLDFGIALHRDRSSTITAVGEVRGKPAYIAPEVLAGAPATRLADVWALGVVLHELMTGRPLFAREHPLAVMQAVLSAPIAAPDEAAPPGPLSELALWALEREPGRRPQTAAAFAEALERHAAEAGADVAAWASGVLVAQRSHHRRWLEGVLGGASGSAGGRALAPEPGPPRRAGAEEATPAASGPLPEVLDGPSTQTLPTRRPTRWARWALAGVSLAGLVTLLAGRPHGEPPAAAPVVPSPAPTEAPLSAPSSVVTPAPISTPEPPREAPSSRPPRKAAKPRSAPTAAAPTPSSPTQGRVTVTAEPYGLVRIDGAMVGPTPLFDFPVATGERQVHLLAPDTGEVRARTTVMVGAASPARVDFR